MESFKKGQEARKLGYNYRAVVEYEGGHPALLKVSAGNLETTLEGLNYKPAFGGGFVIPYKEITAIDSDTAERLSLGRLLMVGLVAFAWKKKEKYLKVTFNYHGLDTHVVFGKLDADVWRGIVSQARASSMQEDTTPATPQEK